MRKARVRSLLVSLARGLLAVAAAGPVTYGLVVEKSISLSIHRRNR